MRLVKPNDYSNPEYIGSKFRKKRLLFFEGKLKVLPRPISIVDIGGTVRFWIDENYHQRKDILITVINLQVEEKTFPNIKTVKANACDLRQFQNDEFDIAFSNSLIEHLYTKENQLRMASEARRVAKYFFIQTPNLYFPIEPHFKFPFFQFLPKSVKILLQTKTSLINGAIYGREYAENIVREIRLLSKSELRELFPNGDLYTERFMGLAKSFVVYNLPPAQIPQLTRTKDDDRFSNESPIDF